MEEFDKTEFTVFDESGETVIEWKEEGSATVFELKDEEVEETVFELGDKNKKTTKIEEEVSLDSALPNGTIFSGKYKITKVLGQGGLGITYLAEEDISGKKVVIKEFFPKAYVKRLKDGSVALKNNFSKKGYDVLLKTFEEEAQNLVKITAGKKHPNIVNLISFEDNINNTKYFLMDYEEGEELTAFLKRENKAIPQKKILQIINPILDALYHIHNLKIYHKDIKPDNIYLRKDGSPMLIDFGASVSTVQYLTKNYAPVEQVRQSEDIKQKKLKPQDAVYGPYTDIYSLGVVLYQMVTGKKPPTAIERMEAINKAEKDPYKSLVGTKGYSSHFLKAIDKALNLSKDDRPKDTMEFKKLLQGSKKKQIIIASIVALLLVVFSVSYFSTKKGTLVVSSNQKDYKVFIDGNVVSLNSNELSLKAGTHNISVQKDGYKSLSDTKIVIKPEQTTNYKIKLVPEKKDIKVITFPKDADIYVNGSRIVGNTFEAKYNKNYTIKVAKEYYKPVELQKTYLSLVETPTLKVPELQREKGVIVFETDQIGAVVSIYDNGKFLKSVEIKEQKTKQILPASNKLRIVIRKDGYSTQRDAQVILSSNQTLKYKFHLKEKLSSADSFSSIPKEPVMVNVGNYKVGKYEVTFDEFVRFLNDSKEAKENRTLQGYKMYGEKIFNYLIEKNGKFGVKFSYIKRPVVYVSWYGANRYVKWLSKKTGKKYTLPTLSLYNELFSKAFNGQINFTNINYDTGTVLNIGNKKSDKLGLYDLLGNVAEWTQTSKNSMKNVIVGGSFRSKRAFISNYGVTSEYKLNINRNDLGFRVISK